MFNAGAVMLGFASHLVLDEIWSIDFRHYRLKSSFGTAIKFWSECWWANLIAYANVIILALLIVGDSTSVPDSTVQDPNAIATQPASTGLQ